MIIYFLALLTAIFYVILLMKCKKNWGKYPIIYLLFILPFALRFAPLIVGLEWRAPIRSSIDFIVSILMMIWCVITIVLLKRIHFFLLAGMITLLCISMLFGAWASPITENVLIRDGIPVCVRENSDPGSMAAVRYYTYINNTFRELIPTEESCWTPK